MKNVNKNQYRSKSCPRFPNQADSNIHLQKLLDTALMFACCAGTVSILSFVMATF